MAAYIEEWRRSSGVSGGSSLGGWDWEEEEVLYVSAATDWGSAPKTLARGRRWRLRVAATPHSLLPGSSTHARRHTHTPRKATASVAS